MLQENAAKSNIEFIPDEEPKQQNDFEEVTFTPDENQPNLMQADIKDDEGLFSKVMNWYSDAVTAQAQLENLQERQKGEMISGAVQGGVNALIGQPADIVGTSLKLAGDIGDMPIIKELGSEMSNKANALDDFLGKRWISEEDEKIDPRISQISKVMASGGMQILPMQASSKYLGGALTYALYTVPDAGETYFGAREEGKSKGESALLGGAVGAGFYTIDRFVDGAKLMKGMQNTAGGLFDVLLNAGKEAGAESLQEAYKNLVTKVGYDDSRNLMEGVLESAIGGFAGGGVAQISVSIGGVEYNPSARFNDARQTALNNGATEQDIGTAMSELYNIMDNNPELASNYLKGVIEKNAAGMTDLIRQMPTNVAYQSVDEFYKTADEFIKNNEGTPEAKEAQKIKTELDEAYKDTYNALENLMPKEQAEANAKLVQGHALFASREFGISPKQYMDTMFADVELSEYYVQEQPKVKRPVSLLRFLIQNGGIKDENGELSVLDAQKGRPGLVNNKYGLSLDRAREMAEEAGYFGTQAQVNYGTTSISDFLDLIDKELRGNKVFTEEDAIKQKEIDERLAEEDARDEAEAYYEKFLDEQGVDYSNMSFEEKKDAFNKLKPEEEPVLQNNQIDEEDFIPFQEAMELAEEMADIDANNEEYTGETINIDGADRPVYNSTGDRIAKSEEALRAFYKWFGDSKVVDEQGRPQVIYHGTKRGDRVGSRFRKERATSGPMAFSTTNKEIAEGYAKSKQDTSLMDEIWGDYNKWFSIDVNGKNYTLDKVWSALDYETMKRVRERAPHITVDYDSNEIPVIYDENVKNGNGGYRPGSQYNNAIRDLVNAWLTSGSLYGREERFIDILETAGIPRDKINYVDPNADYSKVYEMYASIQNPLDTENIDKKVVNKLKQNAKKQEKLKGAYGVDAWDKQTMDPDFWIEQLDYDLKTGSTNVWTSIPDWVTETLKGFGYDGIKDKGGKHGGQIHTVWIPFEENQYKATTNRGTFSADNPDIYYQSAYAGSRVDYDQPSLEAIGSGEGAQVHGYGLYYALSKDVAENYRKARISNVIKKFEYEGKPITHLRGTQIENATPEMRVASALVFSGVGGEYNVSKHKLDRLKDYYQSFIDNSELFDTEDWKKVGEENKKNLKAAQEFDISKIKDVSEKGQVHEVDIPESPYLLDEQKPFSEQSDYVKSILEKEDIVTPTDMSLEETLDYFLKKYAKGKQKETVEAIVNHFRENGDIEGFTYRMANGTNISYEDIHLLDYYNTTGKEIYEKLSKKLGSDKKASEYLESKGIKGITYFGRQDGRCFVIFNPDDVKVIQKFYQGMGKKTPRGAYYNGVIHLFQNADASTFIHESMHFYREELKRLKDKSARAKSILNTLDGFAETEFEKNYKIKTTDIGYAVADKNGRTIYNNQGRLFATSEDAKEYAKEEIIARGFEQYVREGKSPSKYLARAFHSFMNWLKNLYKTAKSLGVELNDDVRQAYGDLLGGQDLDYWMGQSAENIMAETKAVEQDRKAYLDDVIADAVANKGTTVSQGKGKGAKDIWTKAMIPLSTRAKRISPKLRNRLRMFEFNLANELNKKYDKSRPFLDIWKKMSADDAIAFDLALKNDYVEKQQEIIAKYNAEKEWSAIKGLLADIYSDAMNVGLDLGYREDYFPRKVKDVEGFMAYIQGLEDWTRYQQALKEADPENVFTMEEKAEFLNKYLRGFVRVDLMPVKYGSEKTRKIPVVNNDINKFYAESMESYISYIEGMNARIESAKFLGKDATNYEESIGGYLEYLQNNGLVAPNQIDDVREILQARFGQRGVGNRFLAMARDLSYIYTMGGINSAITQIEDFSVSMYKTGVWNTLSTVFGEKQITKKDLGIEKISQEFVDGSKTSQWLNKMFKATGLDKIDSVGKETLVNAMLKKYKQIYAKDPQALRDYIEPVMEDQTNATINDILNGEKSDNVRFLLFSELSDVQPVSLSELPEFYNKSGNMRVLYMLKSFMVKRIDTFRNEAFDKIRSKNRDTRIQGMKNLLSMSVLMMLCGATKDWIIDLLYGRKTVLPELMVNNLLGLFGITKFHLYKAREQGFTGVAKELVVPPLFSFFDDLIGDVFKVSSGKRKIKDMEILKGVPLVGRFYYWWIGGGAEKQKKKKRGVVRK